MKHHRRLGQAAAWLAAAALLALGAAAKKSEEGRAFRRHLRSPILDRSSFPSGDAVAILTRLGRIYPVPPDPHAQPAGRRHLFNGYRLSVDPIPANEAASTLLYDPSLETEPVPLVSLLMDPEDLQRLYDNPRERGAEWEIPGFFALIENGRVRFGSKVGVRLHGGWTRSYPEVASYRVYFRRRDGAMGFPKELLPDYYDGPPPQRLLVRFNGATDRWGREWYFTGPLAYDIARQVGVPAPFTRPVTLAVNGRFLGSRALTEHLGERTFRDRFGHDRFVLLDTKPSDGSPGPVARHGDLQLLLDLRARYERTPRLTMAEVGKDVDLDNLVRFWLAVLFCASEDHYQGPLVRDLSTPDGRWYWTAWDTDLAFGRGHGRGKPWWQVDTLDSAWGNRDLRIWLLRRLMAEDPAFRDFFKQTFEEVMTHRITPAFLAERTSYYAGLIRATGLPEPAAERLLAVASGAEQRKEFLRQKLDEYFDLDMGDLGGSDLGTSPAPPSR